MSTSRKEEIIRKGFLNSLLAGTIEIKDLAGINIDLDIARQAYLQGVQETTQALIELVKENMATAAKQDLQATATKQDEIKNQFGKEYVLTASDVEQLADDSEEGTQSTDYTKFKQFTMLSSGTIRVTGEIKATSPASCNAEIRINDIEIGVYWSTTETSYQPQSSDIGVGEGDLVQYWLRTSQGGSTAWLRFARVKCDQDLGVPAVGVVS